MIFLHASYIQNGKSATACTPELSPREINKTPERYMSTYIQVLACHLRFSKNISGNFSFPPGGVVACTAMILIISTCCSTLKRNFQFRDYDHSDDESRFPIETIRIVLMTIKDVLHINFQNNKKITDYSNCI